MNTHSLINIYQNECDMGNFREIMNAYQLLLNYIRDPKSPKSLSCVGSRNHFNQLANYLGYEHCHGFIFLEISKTGQIIDKTCQHEFNLPPAITIFKKCRSKYIIIYLILKIEGQSDSHANLIIRNTINHTYERFEPHGSSGYYDKQALINTYLETYPIFKDYQYLSPLTFCPPIGPQRRQINNSTCSASGYCSVFSIFYMHLRLISTLTPKQIVDEISTGTGQDILDMILRYLYLLEKYISPSQDEFIKDIYNSSKQFNSCQQLQAFKITEKLKNQFIYTNLSSTESSPNWKFDVLEILDDLKSFNQLTDNTYFQKHPMSMIEIQNLICKAFIDHDITTLVKFPILYQYLPYVFTYNIIDHALFEAGTGQAFRELVRSRSNLASIDNQPKFMQNAIKTNDSNNIYSIIIEFDWNPLTAEEGYRWIFNHRRQTGYFDVLEQLPDKINKVFAEDPVKIKKFKQIISDAIIDNHKFADDWLNIENTIDIDLTI